MLDYFELMMGTVLSSTENLLLLDTIFTIIFLCATGYVFFKLNRITKLTNHRGIKSFRNVFLTLYITFIVRYIFFFISALSLKSYIPFYAIFMIALFFIAIYLSSLVILYLFHAQFWKYFEGKADLKLHLVALAISGFGLFVHAALSFVIIAGIIGLLIYRIFNNYNETKRIDSSNVEKKNFQQIFIINIALIGALYMVDGLTFYFIEFFPNMMYYYYAIMLAGSIGFVFSINKILKH